MARWSIGTVGSLYKLQEASRNCRRPLGDKVAYSKQSARALSPTAARKIVNQQHE